MLFYCLKCRKNTGSKNSKVVSRRNGRIMLLSNCTVYNRKKSKLIREQEANGLLGSLAKPLGKISLVAPILF